MEKLHQRLDCVRDLFDAATKKEVFDYDKLFLAFGFEKSMLRYDDPIRLADYYAHNELKLVLMTARELESGLEDDEYATEDKEYVVNMMKMLSAEVSKHMDVVDAINFFRHNNCVETFVEVYGQNYGIKEINDSDLMLSFNDMVDMLISYSATYAKQVLLQQQLEMYE